MECDCKSNIDVYVKLTATWSVSRERERKRSQNRGCVPWNLLQEEARKHLWTERSNCWSKWCLQASLLCWTSCAISHMVRHWVHVQAALVTDHFCEMLHLINCYCVCKYVYGSTLNNCLYLQHKYVSSGKCNFLVSESSSVWGQPSWMEILLR